MRFGIFARHLAAVVIGMACAAGSANATTMLVNGSCNSVADQHGCLFSGVINDEYYSDLLLPSHPNSYLNAVNAYNAYVALNPSAGDPIDIDPIGQTLYNYANGIYANDNATTDPIVAPDGTTIGEADFTLTDVAKLKLRAGTWELYAGEPQATFMAVDAGNYFVLYQLDNPTNAGDWDTFDIQGTVPGQSPQLFRLILFSTAVPEPATWAMFILGFGMIGASMRMLRRREGLAGI